MSFNNLQFLTIIVNGISFTAAFAALTAAFIMYQATKKFGSGILAHGFKTIGTGVLFLAIGIIIDAINSYLQISYSSVYSVAVFIIKGSCFVIGTYIIVIGSKRTIDKLESLTK